MEVKIITGLEYLLKYTGMAQQELSDKLDCTKQNVNLFVKGKQNIPKKYLDILEKIFNISREYICIRNLTESDKIIIKIEKLRNESEIKERKIVDEDGNEYSYSDYDDEIKKKLYRFNVELKLQTLIDEIKNDFDTLANCDNSKTQLEDMLAVYGLSNTIYKNKILEPDKFIEILRAIIEGCDAEGNGIGWNDFTNNLIELLRIDKFGEEGKLKYRIQKLLMDEINNENVDDASLNLTEKILITKLAYLNIKEFTDNNLKKSCSTLDIETIKEYGAFNILISNKDVKKEIINSLIKALINIFDVKLELNDLENSNAELTNNLIDLLKKYK